MSRRLRLQELSGVFSDHLGFKDFLVLVTLPTPKTSEGGFLKLFSDGVQRSVVGIPESENFLGFLHYWGFLWRSQWLLLPIHTSGFIWS